MTQAPETCNSPDTEAQAVNVALLPCPFCGSKAERHTNPLNGLPTMANCIQCGASAFDKKWNRRAAPALPQDVAALVERLRSSGCAHDMGFDRELGPMGCALDLKGDGGCVCAGLAPAMSEAASLILSQSSTIASAREVIEQLLTALKEAEEWLSGWASAEPYLQTIRNVIAKAEGRSAQ